MSPTSTTPKDVSWQDPRELHTNVRNAVRSSPAVRVERGGEVCVGKSPSFAAVERVNHDAVLEAFVVAGRGSGCSSSAFERVERRVVFQMRDTVVHLRQVLHRVALVVERREQYRRRYAVRIDQRVGRDVQLEQQQGAVFIGAVRPDASSCPSMILKVPSKPSRPCRCARKY
jgi:hypothetical protein